MRVNSLKWCWFLSEAKASDSFLVFGCKIKQRQCLPLVERSEQGQPKGLGLLLSDKDLNILSDITISEDEIAKGMTRDGIRLVCDGVLFDHAPLRDGQVMLEGVGELATWAWTMHTRGKLELPELGIRARLFIISIVDLR